MIRKALLSFIFLFSIGVAKAQNTPLKPDYKAIERICKDETSPFYYPKLFMRYINDDTTLTVHDFQVLYYGFFFQDEYDAYRSEGYKDSIKGLSKKENPSVADRRKMIGFAKRDMRTAPYDLNDLNWLSNLYYTMGDQENYAIYKYKVSMVAKAILATGDGQSETTGLHVLSVGDEYSMLALLGFKPEGHESNSEKKYDYLKVGENGQGVKGVYFDVTQIFEGYTKVKGRNRTN